MEIFLTIPEHVLLNYYYIVDANKSGRKTRTSSVFGCNNTFIAMSVLWVKYKAVNLLSFTGAVKNWEENLILSDHNIFMIHSHNDILRGVFRSLTNIYNRAFLGFIDL